MSKLMLILGIVVAAAAVVVGLLVFFSPGRMQILGVTPEAAAILLVGGLILVGISEIIAALDHSVEATMALRQWLSAQDGMSGRTEQDVISGRTESGRGETTSALAGVPAAAETNLEEANLRSTSEEVSATEKITAVSPSETVATLDNAREEIAEARGEPAEADEEEVAEPEQAAEEPGEEQLYVVEEKFIRGRPARVLSDGTVEAETDEGWMRFENREHLEEYLDAMSPERS
jgi:hypothetical protein